MAETTKIEWCDATFNPWIGCTKVSPGCAHCYAENQTFARAARANGRELWGAGQPRHRTSAAYWRQPLRWNTMQACSTCGHMAGGHVAWCPNCGPSSDWKPRRPRVFCGSLCDWLDDEVPAEWLADLLNLWRACSDIDILALTKRPQLWRRRLEAAADIGSDVAESWLDGHAPANVWIGTTIEDKARADDRIPALLMIPARVRFISSEPLLEGLAFDRGLPGIHWVICGGESGPKARPMHPDWARSLRDQCAAAGVPFLFKQWGELLPREQRSPTIGESLVGPEFRRVGKHAAGRLLDGREHNEFPEDPHA